MDKKEIIIKYLQENASGAKAWQIAMALNIQKT